MHRDTGARVPVYAHAETDAARRSRAAGTAEKAQCGFKNGKVLFAEEPSNVSLGLALFGVGALAVAGGELATLHEWWRPKSWGGTGSLPV